MICIFPQLFDTDVFFPFFFICYCKTSNKISMHFIGFENRSSLFWIKKKRIHFECVHIKRNPNIIPCFLSLLNYERLCSILTERTERTNYIKLKTKQIFWGNENNCTCSRVHLFQALSETVFSFLFAFYIDAPQCRN